MRLFFIAVLAIAIANFNTGCKSGDSGPATFCDTTCLKDSIKFKGDHQLAPYVYITASNCIADTITWSYRGMGVNRKIDIATLLNNPIHINKDYVKCFIKDTAYAWLILNDCASGMGYRIKIPFNKTESVKPRGGGINNTDPKFSIADNLIAHTDRGNIFVEDVMTGKTAMMTFGEEIKDIDFSAIHDHIDSVNITPTKIWARVKFGKEWVVKEKEITLE